MISFLCRGAPVEATTNPTEQVFSCTGRCVGSPTRRGKGTGDGIRASAISQLVFEQGIKVSLITGSHPKLFMYYSQFWFYSLFLQFEAHYYTQKRTGEKMVNNMKVFAGHHAKCCGIQQQEIPLNLYQERLGLSCHPYILLRFTIKPHVLVSNPISARRK